MAQNGTKRIALRELKLTGISCHSIVSLRIEEEAGKHGICRLDVTLAKPLKTSEFLPLGQSKLIVKASADSIIFGGIIVRAVQEELHGVYFLHLTAQTLSGQLDRTARSRTFQSEDKTLDQVLSKVASESGCESLDLKSTQGKEKIPQMLYQDEQTDWEFLHRLAESRGTLLFADGKTDTARVSLGPLPFKTKVPSHILMERGRRFLLGQCECIVKNIDSKASPAYFIETELLTNDLSVGVGYGVSYDGKDQVVKRSCIMTEGSTLVNYIVLIPKEGCRAEARDELRETNRGKYLAGKVLEAQGKDKGNSGRDNCVKVHFDCDKSQDKAKARWIPYMNIVNNYMYSMPDEGDRVSVYFEENGTILAIGSLRPENPKLEDCKPGNRSLLSEDAFLEFQAKELSLMAGKKAGTVFLKESDDKGIVLQAKQNVVMEGSGDIVLQASAGQTMSNQTKMASTHMTGYAAYTATGGTPPSSMFDPSGGTVGVSVSSLKSAGAAKEKPQLSELAKELDKRTGAKEERKSSSESSSGGGSGNLKLKAGKTLLLMVGDSSIEVSKGKIKTKVLYTAGYMPLPGAGGLDAAIGPGKPSSRSADTKAEHGAQDRSRLKEGGKGTNDNKRISKGG